VKRSTVVMKTFILALVLFVLSLGYFSTDIQWSDSYDEIAWRIRVGIPLPVATYAEVSLGEDVSASEAAEWQPGLTVHWLPVALSLCIAILLAAVVYRFFIPQLLRSVKIPRRDLAASLVLLAAAGLVAGAVAMNPWEEAPPYLHPVLIISFIVIVVCVACWRYGSYLYAVCASLLAWHSFLLVMCVWQFIDEEHFEGLGVLENLLGVIVLSSGTLVLAMLVTVVRRTLAKKATGSALPVAAGPKPVRAGKVIRSSWGAYRRSLPLLLSIAAVGLAFPVLRGALVLTGVSALWWAGQALWLPGIVVGLWSGVAMIIAASERHMGRSLTLRDCFVKVEGRFLAYATTTVLYLLICIAGFLALIVPGMFCGTILSLGACVAVLEGKGASSAFRRSRHLIRGSFWRVFLVMLLPAALLAVGIVAACVLWQQHAAWARVWLAVYRIFLWPFWTMVHVVLYRELEERDADAVSTSPTERRSPTSGKLGCLLGVLAVVGLVAIIIGLVVFWIGFSAQLVWRD